MTLRVRIVAAVILALSLALPLLSVPVSLTETPRDYRRPLQQAGGDWLEVSLLLLAFLWPLAALLLTRRPSGTLQRVLAALVEPACAILSVAFILFVLSITFEYRVVFLILFLPVSARAEIGAYAAVAANALYLAAWLWDTFGSFRLRSYRPAT